jgi:hypothetical protein
MADKNKGGGTQSLQDVEMYMTQLKQVIKQYR